MQKSSYNEGFLTLDGVAIEANLAYSYGGGIYTTIGNSMSGLIVKNSTISNNSAGTLGGGIYVAGSGSTGVQILNSTISTNSATYDGSGIFDYSGDSQIVNSTVALNSSFTSTGAGIYTSGGTWLANTIVAGNTNSSGPSDVSGNFSSLSRHNLIGAIDNSTGLSGNGTFYGTKSSPLDAGLDDLDYYGGRTRTHRLLSSSDAVNAGDNSIAEAYDLEFDQRGRARIDFDYGIVDIGAVEAAFAEL